VSAIYWDGGHFITINDIHGTFYMYDGIKCGGKMQKYKSNNFPVKYDNYILNNCFYMTESEIDLYEQRDLTIFSDLGSYTAISHKIIVDEQSKSSNVS
jgi:hypothetical protein